MSTAYTAVIKDGATFEQFMMRCARAMGGCIAMRDDPLDATIPERFEPSSYYAKRREEQRAGLNALHAMTPAEAEVAAAREYAEACASHKQRAEDRATLLNQYNAMLAQVVQWTPPTAEHEPFKEFMLKQIQQSIEFDCCNRFDPPPTSKTGEEWWSDKFSATIDAIRHSTQEYQEEVARTESRNQWLRALRESLR